MSKPGPKQTSILSFFKRKNDPPSTPTAASSVISDGANGQTEKKINGNNKRPLEVEETSAPAVPIVSKNEPTAVDGNLINDGLLDVCFDCSVEEKEDDVRIEENNKENMDGNNNSSTSGNSNFVFVTFRNIIRSVVSDEHFANIFDQTDWSVIQDFTCFPGMQQLTV